MGIELIQKASDSFQRKQRKSLNTLDESDLFSCPAQVTIAVTAVPVAGHAFEVDGWHRLALLQGQLVVLDGIKTVGEVVNPPKSVVDRMKTVSPSMSATVARIFTLTGKAELSLEFA